MQYKAFLGNLSIFNAISFAFVKYDGIAFCYFVVKSVRFPCSDSVKGIIVVDHYGAVEDEMCQALSQVLGTQRAMVGETPTIVIKKRCKDSQNF